jgi:hypothetical protein
MHRETADEMKETAMHPQQVPHRLVGRWEISGGAQGTTKHVLPESDYFLIQHVDGRC